VASGVATFDTPSLYHIAREFSSQKTKGIVNFLFKKTNFSVAEGIFFAKQNKIAKK